ncbi:phosphoethanolamine transferase [Acinetobacter bereziniae]|uniref:phosphoethanolamine transferase n=1 Tax=Acinetobacter bereziniae TaxID=106648 RepID=UPI003570ACAA
MRRFNQLPIDIQRWFFAFYLLLPVLIVFLTLGFAGSWTDSLRLAFLAMPGIWLCFQASSKSKLFWKISAILWWFIFFLHTTLLSLSWWLFNSDAEGYLIVESIANTTFNESLEFIQQHVGLFGLLLLCFLTTLGLYFLVLFKYFDQPHHHIYPKRVVGRSILGFLILLCVVSYVLKPSFALHPLAYWFGYYGKIKDFQSRVSQHHHIHQTWTSNAKKRLDRRKPFAEQQTHTVVLTDSITSFNFGLCGYPRNTTPELSKRSGQFKVFCRGYSPASSTIQSLRYLFNDGTRNAMDDQAPENIMGYAKAAGFKVYWISNQDDVYISSLFANYADEVVFINKQSGRSSRSLDENILPAYKAALDDPTPRKLIILHLIGSHPNYKLRYPEQFSKFNDATNDEVERTLEQNKINHFIQLKRNEYDNSILYQDWIVSKLFDLLLSKRADFRSFTFLSDHGNQVGHELNYAGHSSDTEAGYRVPILIWYDQMPKKGISSQRPVDASDLDRYVLHLMGLHDRLETQEKLCWLDEKCHFIPKLLWR